MIQMCHLKTGFNSNFFIWQCKGDYWIMALVQLEKYLCSYNWQFWCRKILRSKLPRTNLAMPEVSCGVTWSILMALHGILHSEFAVGKYPPDSWLSWAHSLPLDRDVIGIGGSERNSRKASAAQLSVEGGACILSVTTADCAESHEYTLSIPWVNFDVTITKNN